MQKFHRVVIGIRFLKRLLRVDNGKKKIKKHQSRNTSICVKTTKKSREEITVTFMILLLRWVLGASRVLTVI